MNRRPHRLVSIRTLAVVGLLTLFAGLSAWEMAGDSLTSDERVHLPAGYAYWKTRDFRLNPEHPPLVKLLCAAPLLLLELRMPTTTPDPGQTYHAYQPIFGSRFLFSQDADRILFWGRLPALFLGVLLVVLLFFWSWELHGSFGAGLTTLFLAALEPTLLAHSHYVTDDVALACFSVMAFFFLWRFVRTSRLRDLLLAVLGLGLALASKFTSLFLVPGFIYLLAVHWPARGLLAGRRAWLGGGPAARIIVIAGAAIIAAVIVQACYLFSPDLSLYVKGIKAVGANRPAWNPAYVHGTFYADGVFWYPLYAFLLKIPLPTLIVMGVAGIGSIADRRRSTGEWPFLLLPAGVHTLAICLFAYNYGVRYLIPATALLLVLAGRSFLWFAASRARRVTAAVLALWLIGSVLTASPHFISYFNELIGGPANGPYFLNDSNLDWGQDLKRLARYQRDRGIDRMALAYWGPTPPEYYGIRYQIPRSEEAQGDQPPPGVYAISVNHLVDLKRRVVLRGEDPLLDWLGRFTPSDRVGNSILIYRFPRER